MAPYLKLFVVSCLLLCYTLCVPAYSTGERQTEIKSADLFELSKQIEKVQKPTGGTDLVVSKGITLKEIKLPALFAAAKGGVIVAMAEATYTENGGGDDKYDVFVNYFKANNNGNLKEDIFKNVKTDWKTQLATENSGGEKKFSTVRASTVSANRDKIYLFLLNVTDPARSNEQWTFKLVEGKVDSTEANKDKPITWSPKVFTGLKSDDQAKNLDEETLGSVLASGLGFITKDEKKIVLVVKSKANVGSGGDKSTIVLFEFEENGNSALKLSHVESFVGEYSFFQWDDKIFKVPTEDSNTVGKEITVFDASNKNFKETNDPITRLRDFLKDKNNFATATIKEKGDVLLFTQQKHESDSKNNVAYLWMSDGTRVGDVGIIIKDFKNPFFVSFLHTDTDLFALHQTYETENGKNKENNKVYFATLNTQRETIIKTLDAWKNNSGKITNFYKDLATAMRARITDGLVGFLSNNSEDTKWKNEYSNMDATVHGDSKNKVDDGFTFSGKGAGAVWLVSKTENNEQPYNLKDFGFTLVATVKIESDDTNAKNSILGVVFDQSGKNGISLWCNGGKWVVSDDNNQAATPKTKTCVKDGIYQVALMLNGDTFSVHIGAEQLHKIKDAQPPLSITHFYFGADNNKQNEESHVTVTNVLLYNQPFESTDINKLKEYVTAVKNTTRPDKHTTTTAQGNEQTSTRLTDLKKTEDEKEAPSLSRTEDGGVGGGVRVFSLLLAVLCVSAPLLHL